MASTSHQGPFLFTFGGAGLEPGQSENVFFFGGTINTRSTVTITAIPAAPGIARVTVGDLSIRTEPQFGAATVVHAEATITNTGEIPLNSIYVELSTVNY